MKLRHLSLITFRNYFALELDLEPGINLFIGANAQGKTNLLEACHLLATGRSHRTFRDQEMIAWQQEGFHIKATVQKKLSTELIELHVNRQGHKIVKLNGLLQPRLGALLGQLNVVFFAPEHLLLVKGDPSGRRRFLDIAISQISPSYLHHLARYHKILNQKNILLKTNRPDETLLSIYNQQLSESGGVIVAKRSDIITQLEINARKYQHLLRETENLSFTYQSQTETKENSKLIAEELFHKMEERKEDELQRRTGLVGPHRDDFSIYLNDVNVRQYGSQGQQRSVVLSIKMAEANLMEESTGEQPVIILDDVLSELDPARQSQLIAGLKHIGQTLISSTDLPPVLSGLNSKVFRVNDGKIIIS
ncbi:MAG TPA: DNA replication/repair protein RecF [Bacillota bacterium]|nr:DNA replication/repair protein RecF [Bacillota bacterium]